MQNKYTLFSAVYRYNSTFDHLVDDSLIHEEFYKSDRAFDLGSLALLRKRLEHNHDITDEESCVAALNDLMANRLYAHPFFSIIADVWKYNKNLGDPTSLEYQESSLTDDAILKKIKLHTEDFGGEEESYIVSLVRDQVADFFMCKESLVVFHKFFSDHQELLELASPYPIWGFDIARFVEMLTMSHNVKYLSDEVYEYHINKLGECVVAHFTSWEQFLASAVLGKLYMSQGREEKSVSIMGTEDFIRNIYGLICSPNRILELSTIWPNSNLTKLKLALERVFKFKPSSKKYLTEYGANAQLEEESIRLFNKYILDPLRHNNIEKYFTENWSTNHLYYAQIDMNDGLWFWKKVSKFKDKFELFFSQEEIPLMVIGDSVITNKALYVVKRSFLRRKLQTIPLNKTKFKLELDKKGNYIKVIGNGVELTSLAINSSHVGKTKEVIQIMKKSEIQPLINDDLKCLNEMFHNLKSLDA